MTTGERLRHLWRTGELARMARQSKTNADLAALVGVTPCAYEKARARIPGFPTLKELQGQALEPSEERDAAIAKLGALRQRSSDPELLDYVMRDLAAADRILDAHAVPDRERLIAGMAVRPEREQAPRSWDVSAQPSRAGMPNAGIGKPDLGTGEIVEVNDFEDEEPTQVTQKTYRITDRGVEKPIPAQSARVEARQDSRVASQPGVAPTAQQQCDGNPHHWDGPESSYCLRCRGYPAQVFESNERPRPVQPNHVTPVKTAPSLIHRLSFEDIPSGSVIGVLSDIHIPHHDEEAMRLVVECLEDAGVTHVILNGDIADCGPASRHPDKRQRAMLDEGDLRESVAPGRWIYDWARTKRCKYVLGNHEAWVVDAIAKSPELRGTAATELMGLPADGDGWDVLRPLSRIQFGSRCWEHLDAFFKTGNGGANPGARIKQLAPDHSTSGGHLHRRGSFFWSSVDETGVSRTYGAFFNGHLSKPEAHHDYMGAYMNWQQSFEITRAWDDNGRPRFTTDQPEIHRTKQGRPIFEYGGKVYGR